MRLNNSLRLVLTQPLPNNQDFFVKLGYRCVSLPMFSIKLDPPNITEINRYFAEVSMVAAVSPAVVHWLALCQPQAWQQALLCQWFCPGSGTANCLSEWGVQPLYPKEQSNAVAMVELMQANMHSETLTPKALWISGRGYQSAGLQALLDADITPLHWHCYSRNAIDYTYQQLHTKQLFDHCYEDYWLVSSLGVLSEVIKLWRIYQKQSKLVVTSRRLEEQANSLGYTCLVSQSNRVADIHALFCNFR